MTLEHTERVTALLGEAREAEADGKPNVAALRRNEAKEARDKRWDDQGQRAKEGHIINLTDLLAGDEAFVIDRIERESEDEP